MEKIHFYRTCNVNKTQTIARVQKVTHFTKCWKKNLLGYIQVLLKFFQFENKFLLEKLSLKNRMHSISSFVRHNIPTYSSVLLFIYLTSYLLT